MLFRISNMFGRKSRVKALRKAIVRADVAAGRLVRGYSYV